MTDAPEPLWETWAVVDAEATPQFAFRYWTDFRNMAADPGIVRVETDGPLGPGMRGTTHLAGGGTTEWVVAEVEGERRFVIEICLPDAALRFELRFECREGGGSRITQRIGLTGPGAAAHLAAVRAGFEAGLQDGMRAVRDRIDAAPARR